MSKQRTKSGFNDLYPNDKPKEDPSKPSQRVRDAAKQVNDILEKEIPGFHFRISWSPLSKNLLTVLTGDHRDMEPDQLKKCQQLEKFIRGKSGFFVPQFFVDYAINSYGNSFVVASFSYEKSSFDNDVEKYYNDNQKVIDREWEEFCFEPGRFESGTRDAQRHFDNDKYFWDFVAEKMDKTAAAEFEDDVVVVHLFDWNGNDKAYEVHSPVLVNLYNKAMKGEKIDLKTEFLDKAKLSTGVEHAAHYLDWKAVKSGKYDSILEWDLEDLSDRSEGEKVDRTNTHNDTGYYDTKNSQYIVINSSSYILLVIGPDEINTPKEQDAFDNMIDTYGFSEQEAASIENKKIFIDDEPYKVFFNSRGNIPTEKDVKEYLDRINNRTMHAVARLIQKHNKNTDREEWALVSKKDSSKVLEWFGVKKPSEDKVKKSEQRVQYFKHANAATAEKKGTLTQVDDNTYKYLYELKYDDMDLSTKLKIQKRSDGWWFNASHDIEGKTPEEVVDQYWDMIKQNAHASSEGDPAIIEKLKKKDYSGYFTNRMGPAHVDKVEFKDGNYYVHTRCNRFGHGSSYEIIKFDSEGNKAVAAAPIVIPDEDSLGVPRRNMPQIKRKHMEKFVDWLKSEGVKVRGVKIPLKDLKPTQKDFNTQKVHLMMNEDKHKLSKPLFVSKDNYILDGHHKWLAQLNIDDTKKARCIQVDLDAKEFLDKAKEFDKVRYKDINDNTYKDTDPNLSYADVEEKDELMDFALAAWDKPEGVTYQSNTISFKGPDGQMGVLKYKKKGQETYWSRGKHHTLEEIVKKISDKTGFDDDEIKKALKKGKADTTASTQATYEGELDQIAMFKAAGFYFDNDSDGMVVYSKDAGEGNAYFIAFVRGEPDCVAGIESDTGEVLVRNDYNTIEEAIDQVEKVQKTSALLSNGTSEVYKDVKIIIAGDDDDGYSYGIVLPRKRIGNGMYPSKAQALEAAKKYVDQLGATKADNSESFEIDKVLTDEGFKKGQNIAAATSTYYKPTEVGDMVYFVAVSPETFGEAAIAGVMDKEGGKKLSFHHYETIEDALENLDGHYEEALKHKVAKSATDPDIEAKAKKIMDLDHTKKVIEECIKHGDRPDLEDEIDRAHWVMERIEDEVFEAIPNDDDKMEELYETVRGLLENFFTPKAESAKYGDVKGQEPADKDIQRMKDLQVKAKGDEAKMLKLAQNMANTLGVSPDSVDKAIRRAKAAEKVYPGALGKKIAKIFMDVIEAPVEDDQAAAVKMESLASEGVPKWHYDQGNWVWYYGTEEQYKKALEADEGEECKIPFISDGSGYAPGDTYPSYQQREMEVSDEDIDGTIDGDDMTREEAMEEAQLEVLKATLEEEYEEDAYSGDDDSDNDEDSEDDEDDDTAESVKMESLSNMTKASMSSFLLVVGVGEHEDEDEDGYETDSSFKAKAESAPEEYEDEADEACKEEIDAACKELGISQQVKDSISWERIQYLDRYDGNYWFEYLITCPDEIFAELMDNMGGEVEGAVKASFDYKKAIAAHLGGKVQFKSVAAPENVWSLPISVRMERFKALPQEERAKIENNHSDHKHAGNRANPICPRCPKEKPKKDKVQGQNMALSVFPKEYAALKEKGVTKTPISPSLKKLADLTNDLFRAKEEADPEYTGKGDTVYDLPKSISKKCGVYLLSYNLHNYGGYDTEYSGAFVNRVLKFAKANGCNKITDEFDEACLWLLAPGASVAKCIQLVEQEIAKVKGKIEKKD